MGCCLETFQVDPLSSRHDIDIDVNFTPSKPAAPPAVKPQEEKPQEVEKPKQKSKSSSSSSSDAEPQQVEAPKPPEPEPEPEPQYLPDYQASSQPKINEVSLAGVSVQVDDNPEDFAFELATPDQTPANTEIITENFSLEFTTPKPPTVPVYRYYSSRTSDHFYTTKAAEIGTTQNGVTGNHGYISEGVGFYLAESQADGYTPVYRFWNDRNNDHFYTANQSESDGVHVHGYKAEGVVGYIATSQIEGTIPVHRYWNSGAKDHFYTTNGNEIGVTEVGASRNGYQYEGVLGYAFEN